MISKSGMGKGFSGLISYLTEEKKFDWMETRNVVSSSSNSIAKEMQIYSMKSRAKKPVYHVSISWDKSDEPTRKQMIEVGDRFLKHMGLEDHQSVIVSHKDKEYPHIHLMINRVHPTTEKAWENYLFKGKGRNRKIVKGEYQRREEFLREIEKEFDWKLVPGKHTIHGKGIDFDNQKTPKKWQIHRANNIRKAAAGAGFDPEKIDPRSAEEKANALKDELFKARSFEEFDTILARKGLWIEPKGQGGVITDGGPYPVKLSNVSRQFSKGKLEKKFKEDFKEYIQYRNQGINPEAGDQVVTQALTNHMINELESAKEITKKRLKQIELELALIEASPEFQSIKKNIENGFQQVYKEPKGAFERFSDVVGREDFYKAYECISEQPDSFGDIKDAEAVHPLMKHLRRLESKNQQAGHYIHFLFEQDYKKKLAGQKKNLRKSYLDVSKELASLKKHSDKALGKMLAQTEAGQDLLKFRRGASKGIHLVRTVISFHKSFQRMMKTPQTTFQKSLVRSLGPPTSATSLKALEAGFRMILNQLQAFRSKGQSR